MLNKFSVKGLEIPCIFEENGDLPVVFLRLSFENAGKAYESDFIETQSKFSNGEFSGDIQNKFSDDEFGKIQSKFGDSKFSDSEFSKNPSKFSDSEFSDSNNQSKVSNSKFGGTQSKFTDNKTQSKVSKSEFSENSSKFIDTQSKFNDSKFNQNSPKNSTKNSQKSDKSHSNADVAGLARMFARLLNEGTDERFFKELEFRAINLSASSGFESFDLGISCLKEHFKFALKKLCELLKSPNFDEKILAKLKTTTLGELAAKNSDFDYLAKRLLNRSVFEYKEFESSNDGDETSINAMQISHLRGFYKHKLTLSNLNIIAGGDVKFSELKTLLSPIFEALPKGTKAADKKFTLSKPKDEILVRKDSEQAYIYFCAPFALEFADPVAHLGKLALFVLGAGGFGSRLMEEVRVKRGLAYSAYAMSDLTRCFKRVFGYLQTKNESAKEAQELVKSLFADFVKKGVSQNELDLAKKFLIGSTPLRYESLEKRLGVAALEHYQGLNLGHFKKESEKIKACSLKDLNDFIKSHKEIANLSFARVSK